MLLVTADEMRAMDGQTITELGIPGRVLMENAGRGAVRFFLECFAASAARRSVAVIAGRGNNGGDGFVMARYLHQLGWPATVYLLAESSAVRGDAAANLALLAPLGVPVVEIPDSAALASAASRMRHEGIWIDAILGTGLTSDVRDFFREVIEFINGLKRPIFSVDIPSGLSSETGQPCGACIRADATATFGCAKVGHVLFPGARLTGRLSVVDIGIPPSVADRVAPGQQLLTHGRIRQLFQPRLPEAHKGSTGHLLVLAGSTGKSGAAAMTAASAARSGAGLVTLAIPASLNPVLESHVTEVMTLPVPETADGAPAEAARDSILSQLEGKRCLAVGPGIGTAATTQRLVIELVRRSTVPMVIDADGLNCLAGDIQALAEATAPVVLTPHPGEMARLGGRTTAEIQADRVGSARAFAEDHGVHLVLKGARTVVATPDGIVYVNPTGNPGMASGGMGDVLTGVIAGLITQGMTPTAAACAGVFLHGLAADRLAGTVGPIGYLATDVMARLPECLRLILNAPPDDTAHWPLTQIPPTMA